MDDLSKSPDAQALANCPVSRTLEVVGARSTLLIMREAFFGTRRFQDFTKRVGIGEAATAGRLRELTASGLLEKIPYQEPGQRGRYEYQLTDKGQDLFAAIMSLRDWGESWASDGHGPTPWRFTHRDCGEEVHTVTRCSAGHDVHAGDCTAVREPRRAVGDPVS
ncbi:helix-turn-helix transcriptional regulator [Streptomyces sp. NBC_01317]|uniref:winged helix-turn-helix transcriptional regulator n=1 Tax=Streptomyces sp. NBC_01317 TaxID=2903822 RepID=UPI002E0DC5C8|nr:helix-turn-helix transcriptional regulator [Streptomyces sp. NBC_01317]